MAVTTIYFVSATPHAKRNKKVYCVRTDSRSPATARRAAKQAPFGTGEPISIRYTLTACLYVAMDGVSFGVYVHAHTLTEFLNISIILHHSNLFICSW